MCEGKGERGSGKVERERVGGKSNLVTGLPFLPHGP